MMETINVALIDINLNLYSLFRYQQKILYELIHTKYKPHFNNYKQI